MKKEIMALLATQTLSGDQLACLSRDQIAYLSRDQPVPVIDKLYSQLSAAIKSKQRSVEQSTFGPYDHAEENVCETPMCIAGHTVNLAGKPGYELCRRVGFAAAAHLIHTVSRPDVSAPRYDSYPNEWALAYIETRAAEEA